ncbi:hypothetical protein HY486_03095 [Candidatus Woesearchaeota archaeon]|nr:hypothetical protein [Candidatus Woesearchaeota archaeon]
MSLPEYQQQLKEWYAKSEHKDHPTKFAKAAGISHNTVHRLLGEDAYEFEKLTTPTRAKLFRMTGIESLKPEYLSEAEGKTTLSGWQISLKTWMLDNEITPKKAKAMVGIAEDTLRGYFNKPQKIDRISFANRKKLYELTQMAVFNCNGAKAEDDAVEERSDSLVAEVQKLQQMVANRMPLQLPQGKSTVDEVVRSFYNFSKKLEDAVKDESTRKAITRRIKKADVGRATSLLHAMYKADDDFDRWMYLSSPIQEGLK